MKRLYVLAPLLALTAFAGYYQYWDHTVVTCAIPMPPKSVSFETPLSEFERRDGQREAEADIRRQNLTLVTFGLPVHWDSEYREVLEHDYHVKLRRIAGCDVTDALVAYARDYNGAMEQHVTKIFGNDVFAVAQKKAVRLYAERQAAERGQRGDR